MLRTLLSKTSFSFILYNSFLFSPSVYHWNIKFIIVPDFSRDDNRTLIRGLDENGDYELFLCCSFDQHIFCLITYGAFHKLRQLLFILHKICR